MENLSQRLESENPRSEQCLRIIVSRQEIMDQIGLLTEYLALKNTHDLVGFDRVAVEKKSDIHIIALLTSQSALRVASTIYAGMADFQESGDEFIFTMLPDVANPKILPALIRETMALNTAQLWLTVAAPEHSQQLLPTLQHTLESLQNAATPIPWSQNPHSRRIPPL